VECEANQVCVEERKECVRAPCPQYTCVAPPSTAEPETVTETLPCPQISCVQPREGCEYDHDKATVDENGCTTDCGPLVCKIPPQCVSWFDGCNTCAVEKGQLMQCTERACAPDELAQPRCRQFDYCLGVECGKNEKCVPAEEPCDGDRCARYTCQDTCPPVPPCAAPPEGCDYPNPVYDSNGCFISCGELKCECPPAPTCAPARDNCKLLEPARDANGCVVGCGEEQCECPPQPTCSDVPDNCRRVAPVKDDNGCEIGCGDVVCRSSSTPESTTTPKSTTTAEDNGCEPLLCRISCAFGLAVDLETGCSKCACKTPPRGCKTYFDGCNTCEVDREGANLGCTKRACEKEEAPACREYHTPCPQIDCIQLEEGCYFDTSSIKPDEEGCIVSCGTVVCGSTEAAPSTEEATTEAEEEDTTAATTVVTETEASTEATTTATMATTTAARRTTTKSPVVTIYFDLDYDTLNIGQFKESVRSSIESSVSGVTVERVDIYRASVKAEVTLGDAAQASSVASAVATGSLAVQHNSQTLGASSTNPSTSGDSDDKGASAATVAAIVAGVAAGLCLLVLVVVVVSRRKPMVLPDNKQGGAISYNNPYFHDVVADANGQRQNGGASMFANPSYESTHLAGDEPTYATATDA